MKQQDSLWIIVICSFKPCCKINNSNSTSKISSSIILGSNLHVFSWYVFILELFITYCTVLRSFLDCIFICFCVMRLFFDVLSQRWHCWYHFWIKSSRVFAMCFILEPFYHMLDSENSILWSDLHMPSHHSKTYEDPIKEWYYHCPTCDKKFKNRSTSRKHAKIWNKNDIGNVTFVTKHQRIVAAHKDIWKCNPRMCNKW